MSSTIEPNNQKDSENKLSPFIAGITKLNNDFIKNLVLYDYIMKSNFKILFNYLEREVKLERNKLTNEELQIVMSHYKEQNYDVELADNNSYLLVKW